MNDKLYLINGNWLTYEEAHDLGYTLQKPNILTFYSTDLVETPVIQDTSNSTFYDSVNQQWVSDIDDLNLYKFVGDIIMFDGEIQHTFVAYSSSAFSDEASHVYIDNSFASIENLYDNGGFTFNQCVDYIVDEGERLVWYDPNTELYWDNRDGRKLWVDTPPVISKSELQDVFIMPNPGEIYLLPQWEEDLSQMPMRYRSWSFDEQNVQMDTQDPVYRGLSLVFGNDNALVSPMVVFYPDITELNKTFYVYTSKGVVDYQGNNYSQGDTFTGDYMKVYVDSDDDVIFYKGQDQFIFGQSHDESYPELYWCEDEYKTYQEVLNLGYSPTPSDIGLKAADTNVEFNIDNTYDVMENKSLGYYCNGEWYSTLADLNNAGYYLVEKITLTVHPSNGTYCIIEPSITKNSVSFNTSGFKITLKTEDNSDYIYWDGHNWFIDPSDSKEFEYSEQWITHAYALNLSNMPSSTVTDYNKSVNLYVPITSSGTPINKFSSNDDGKMYIYMCTSYSGGTNSIYCSYFQYVKMSYWKLI